MEPGVKNGMLALKYRGLHNAHILLQDAVTNWKWPDLEQQQASPIHENEEYDSDASDEP